MRCNRRLLAAISEARINLQNSLPVSLSGINNQDFKKIGPKGEGGTNKNKVYFWAFFFV